MTTVKQNKSEGLNMPSLPITFSEFVKSPITGMLFLCLFGLGFMIYDMKVVSQRQEERIITLEQEIRHCYSEIQKLREDNGALKAELSLRKEFNISQK
jgi:hypothetical protein